MFDVDLFLQKNHIHTSPKNAASGWREINCPFGCGDPSTHLGIASSGGWHCWICGKKNKSPIPLVAKLLKVSFKTAEDIVKEYDDNLFPEKEIKKESKLITPTGLSSVLPQNYKAYLIRRGFSEDLIAPKYQLFSGGFTGYFSYRIVFPIFQNGEVVNYQGRDITGQQKERYLSWPNDKAAINIRDCVYNLDNIKGKTAVIVEGPIDVWKGGDNFVATFGTEFTKAQVRSLIFKELERCFILYDNISIAQKSAEALSHHLSLFIPHVEVINMKGAKDVGELSEKEVKELREYLEIE
jgi:DNA primase